MKQYTITVNGVAYDVTVEEKNGGVVSAPKAVEKSAPAAAAPVVRSQGSGKIRSRSSCSCSLRSPSSCKGR